MRGFAVLMADRTAGWAASGQLSHEADRLQVTPTQTEYTFEAARKSRLQATFLSPSIPTDFDLLAQPVTISHGRPPQPRKSRTQ